MKEIFDMILGAMILSVYLNFIIVKCKKDKFNSKDKKEILCISLIFIIADFIYILYNVK